MAFLGLREVKYFKLLFSETNEKENEFGLITFEDQKNKKNNSIAKYITLWSSLLILKLQKYKIQQISSSIFRAMLLPDWPVFGGNGKDFKVLHRDSESDLCIERF